MKISVCYEEGHAPGSAKCRIYGFGTSPSEVEDGWTVYAVYELPDMPKLAGQLIEALAGFEVEYDDPSFESIVPDSANVVSGLIDMILARSDYSDIPYRSLTRPWRADYCIEVVRRKIPASEGYGHIFREVKRVRPFCRRLRGQKGQTLL